MDDSDKPAPLISRRQAAREINMSEVWVQKLIDDGQLQAWQSGRRIMIYRSSLEKWQRGLVTIEQQQSESA